MYHYTSPDGLLGMVKSKALWATDVRYLNDAQEFQYARAMALDSFDAFRDTQGKPPDQIAQEEFRRSLGAAGKKRIYVISFSEEGDLLSQWRAYCPPSGGLSLGFPPQPLAHATRCTLFPCIYDVSTQREFLKALIDAWYEDYLKGIPAFQSTNKRDAVRSTDLTIWFLALAAVFKHPGFREEREWRLVTRGDIYSRNQLFRAGRSGIVPYIERPLAAPGYPIRLRRIVVGPNPHQPLTIGALKSLLVKEGWMYDGLDSSKTPYRAW
jgi:hypothetical protein